MADLSIVRGDDYDGSRSLPILVTDTDTGLPIDLSGASLWWYVKAHKTDLDADALIAKTSDDGITIAPDQTGDKGEALIALDRADTEDLEPGVYPWELQGELGGNIATLQTGRIRIARDLIQAVAIP